MKDMKIMRKSIIIFFFYSFLTSHHITSLHIVYGDMYMKCTHFAVHSFNLSCHIKSNHSLFYRTSFYFILLSLFYFILSYFILFYLISFYFIFVFILFYLIVFTLFYLFYFIVFILFCFTVLHFLLFYLILFRPIRKQLWNITLTNKPTRALKKRVKRRKCSEK